MAFDAFSETAFGAGEVAGDGGQRGDASDHGLMSDPGTNESQMALPTGRCEG